MKGIEKYICSGWSGWDLIDTGVFMFYDPILLDNVKELVGHDEVSYVVVDTSNCILQFYVDEDNYVELDFKIEF